MLRSSALRHDTPTRGAIVDERLNVNETTTENSAHNSDVRVSWIALHCSHPHMHQRLEQTTNKNKIEMGNEWP